MASEKHIKFIVERLMTESGRPWRRESSMAIQSESTELEDASEDLQMQLKL